MLTPPNDEQFMRMAIREAEKALDQDEIPVGAIIVAKGQVIARGHNLTERLHDFTAHAEMQAFTAASEFLGGKFLDQCTLYVTLEPCPMCAGAAFWTRIGRVVFGAYDEKRGYQRFQSKMPDEHVLHPRTAVKGGVLEEECAELLKEFFQKKRQQRLN
ncbi:nucleoside deaminase [Sanyastnella coralliicola]|uniref:nucleoside deaminase n=1 Tax=Sanyastnella coralliicola TaxID=3069118 RepID=UPI0027B95169|nr:nucleoside deaminase [Longitalea sp. SCSIO 12813]